MKSKTDQRALGLWYILPTQTALEINPTDLLQQYIRNTYLGIVGERDHLFRQFHQYTKRYTAEPLSVRSWNERLTKIQEETGIQRRTSHAIRATAISLCPLDDLYTIAQVGGWKSMTYMTTYHRTPIEDRTTALANIGKRILIANHSMADPESDNEA